MFATPLGRKQLSRIPTPYCAQAEEFLEQTRLCCAHLAPETKTIIRKLTTGAYTHYQFTGVPITKRMPPTPETYPPPEHSPTYQADAIIGRLAQSLGRMFGYRLHRQHLLYDIYPVRGYEQSSSFINSRKMLGFHSDGSAHTKLIPDYTLLFCIRSDPNSINLIADVKNIVKQLPKWVMDELFEPNFLHMVSQNPPRTIRKPILSHEDGELSIAYDDETVSGTDARSKNALELLNQASEQTASPIKNHPNSLLVLNNKRCLHARTAFTPKYNGEDRWIKGTYVSCTPIKNGTILTLDP